MGGCVSNPEKQVKRARSEQLATLTYANTNELTYNFTEAKVLKVYDGDSLTIGAYYDGGFKKFNVRIFGIDCDELKGGNSITRENGVRAKKYVEKLVLNKIINIDVLNNKIIDGKKLREKFGRLLAKITTPDGQDLGDELFIAGLARRYYGGKKENTPLDPKIDISIHSEDPKYGSDKDTVEY